MKFTRLFQRLQAKLMQSMKVSEETNSNSRFKKTMANNEKIKCN